MVASSGWGRAGWARVLLAMAGAGALLAACGSTAHDHAASSVTSAHSIASTTSSSTSAATSPTMAPPPPAGAAFHLTSTTAAVGQVVTATGRGCPVGDQVRVGFTASADPIDLVSGGPIMDPAVVSGPTWTASVTVPAAAVGAVRVDAACSTASTALLFIYPATILTVSTDRHLAVTPTTVAAGGTLVVRSSGPDCRQGGLNTVQLALKGPTVVYPDPTFTDLGAQWQATFAIPAGTPPGAYVLYADCQYSRSTVASYASVPVTVEKA